MSDRESAIRAELGIPDNASRVLILSMDAHMDWDWLVTFQDYLNGVGTTNSAVTDIINTAFSYMSGTVSPTTYYYSICEMGFFEAAVQSNPSLLRNFHSEIGERLRIVGGGVTSPDNLLPHGEALVRNYLIGKHWMQRTFGLPLRQAYVPDDFGNDSQFPVLLEAMGIQGVSFSRIPGSPSQAPGATYDTNKSLNNTLVADGVDFVWQAADGSTTIAHYMQQTYCQGSGINNPPGPTANIQGYININGPSAITPYIYVPCGCDFLLPIENLVTIATNWNSTQFDTGASDVYVVVAALDHYNQLISTYVDPSVNHPYGPYTNLSTFTFFPTPYWTGHYASRIGNKILHQAATRALLGAETFGAIADLIEQPDAFGFQWLTKGRREAIENGWKALVPSTHHDYINGTATDGVYTTEQRPLLSGVLRLATGARASAIDQIAAQLTVSPAYGQTPIAVFNQLGFTAPGPAWLPAVPGLAPQSVTFQDGSRSPVQPTHDGGLLFIASAPSLGYQAGYLSSATVTPADTVTLTPVSDGYTLENGALRAVITGGKNWGIYILVDKQSGIDIIPGDGTGNDLEFYIDRGGLYRFGNEYNYGSGNFQIDPHGSLTGTAVEVLESGPVRAWLRTTATFRSQDSSGKTITATYVRDYILVAGEPFLRMSLTGAAPLNSSGAPTSANHSGNQYSVLVRFPLTTRSDGNQAVIDDVSYGTPNHWVEQMPEPYWPAPIFQAMHDVAIMQSAGKTLGAIYQSTIPAWGVDSSGAFIGCVLRNTPYDYVGGHGANGQDTDIHTHHYALRVPSSIQDMTTGAQLQESLAFTTPLHTRYAGASVGVGTMPTGKFPATFSLASASPASAIITAAKPGTLDPSSLVFRVYQPTNSALSVKVTLASSVTTEQGTTVRLVTALEDPIEGSSTLPIDDSSVTFNAARAITTIEVDKPSSSTQS